MEPLPKVPEYFYGFPITHLLGPNDADTITAVGALDNIDPYLTSERNQLD